MNISENILDDKHFNFLKELSERKEAKRKYLKPLENLLSFFYVGEKMCDLSMELKQDDFFKTNDHSIKLYMGLEKENIRIDNNNLQFFKYMSKHGKELEILLEGWEFNIIGEKECI